MAAPQANVDYAIVLLGFAGILTAFFTISKFIKYVIKPEAEMIKENKARIDKIEQKIDKLESDSAEHRVRIGVIQEKLDELKADVKAISSNIIEIMKSLGCGGSK